MVCLCNDCCHVHNGHTRDKHVTTEIPASQNGFGAGNWIVKSAFKRYFLKQDELHSSLDKQRIDRPLGACLLFIKKKTDNSY